MLRLFSDTLWFSLCNLQLCGSRGGGNAAACAVFWQTRKNLSYTLAFETDRDRNAAIMLARKFASNCNVSVIVLKNLRRLYKLGRKQPVYTPFVC